MRSAAPIIRRTTPSLGSVVFCSSHTIGTRAAFAANILARNENAPFASTTSVRERRIVFNNCRVGLALWMRFQPTPRVLSTAPSG
jgi:hypothetical protein